MKKLLLSLLMLLVLSCNTGGDYVTPVMKEAPKKNIEPILVKWVYDHSKQISARTCDEIVKECMKTDKPLLIIAVMDVESNFIQSAVSSKGAIGLGQIMPGVHEKELIKKGIIKEKRDLFDIAPNIQAMNYVLNMNLVQSKDDVPKALELYLGGQDGYYVKRILSSLANLYIICSK